MGAAALSVRAITGSQSVPGMRRERQALSHSIQQANSPSRHGRRASHGADRGRARASTATRMQLAKIQEGRGPQSSRDLSYATDEERRRPQRTLERLRCSGGNSPGADGRTPRSAAEKRVQADGRSIIGADGGTARSGDQLALQAASCQPVPQLRSARHKPSTSR